MDLSFKNESADERALDFFFKPERPEIPPPLRRLRSCFAIFFLQLMPSIL